MTKPPGVALEVGARGINMFVRQPSRVEDHIWDIVREAVDANWTVERFRRECAEAWSYKQREDAKADAAEWEKK